MEKQSFSRSKSFVFSFVILIGFLLTVEVFSRVAAFVVTGFSPYYLMYGLVDAFIDNPEEGHSATYDGYFKFPPSRRLKQYGMFREPTPIRIKGSGWRTT